MDLFNITDDQMEKFCNQFNCELAAFRLNDLNKKQFYLKMYHADGSQPEFVVTSKYCKGIAAYKGYDLTREWKDFLNELEKTNESNTENNLDNEI